MLALLRTDHAVFAIVTRRGRKVVSVLICAFAAVRANSGRRVKRFSSETKLANHRRGIIFLLKFAHAAFRATGRRGVK